MIAYIDLLLITLQLLSSLSVVTILNGVLVILKLASGLAVGLLLLIGADLAYYEYRNSKREREKKRQEEERKAQLRAEKEIAAREEAERGGFFEESYVRGFRSDGGILPRGRHRARGDAAWEYYKILDELGDTQIFINTEEL